MKNLKEWQESLEENETVYEPSDVDQEYYSPDREYPEIYY